MICIHHDDLDGRMSAAIVKLKYPECECIEMSYKDVKDFDLGTLKGKIVYMVDFSFPMEKMMKIKDIAEDFIWIDHHKTAIKAYIDLGLSSFYPKGICEVGLAACELTWEYIHGSKDYPPYVKLAGDYDVWRKYLGNWETEIVPFQMFAREKTIRELVDLLDPLAYNPLPTILMTGRAILDYQDSIDAKNAKNCFELKLEGLDFICLNTQTRGSRIFKSIWDNNKYHAMLVYCYTGSEYSYSLYTDKAIDLTPIAKKFGGGGHPGACGFISGKLPWELNIKD